MSENRCIAMAFLELFECLLQLLWRGSQRQVRIIIYTVNNCIPGVPREIEYGGVSLSAMNRVL